MHRPGPAVPSGSLGRRGPRTARLGNYLDPGDTRSRAGYPHIERELPTRGQGRVRFPAAQADDIARGIICHGRHPYAPRRDFNRLRTGNGHNLPTNFSRGPVSGHQSGDALRDYGKVACIAGGKADRSGQLRLGQERAVGQGRWKEG